MKLKHLILYIAAFILWPVTAQSNEPILCKQALTQPIYLIDVGKAAAEAKKVICSAGSQIEVNSAYVYFLNNIRGWFDPYGGFEGHKSVIDAIRSQITVTNPSVIVDLSLDGRVQVGSDSFNPEDESKCVQASGATNCAEVLKEFIKLYMEIQSLREDLRLQETLITLKNLRADWDPFLEKMKGQTSLELWINRYAYKNDTDTFAGPPSSQWIFLHPTVLIGNVAAAADGENTQEALGLEVIGMNWWKQDKWYVPSGVSALAVYSDRADIEDVGYGLAFHFLSNYTFGYTNHDGEDGFYVSVDVVKLFQDKRKVFESYKAAFD